MGDYAAVFLTRPDAALTGASNAGVIAPAALPMRARLTAPLDLARVCSERPGLSIITGSSRHENRAGRLLNRDHDYMMLACTPAALLLMLFQTRPGQTSCIHDVPPARPGITPHHRNCKRTKDRDNDVRYRAYHQTTTPKKRTL